ncbi:hypothetical protein [Baaleninema simplex]|nr:hypothetical protein [Baaleninema simplex]
MESTENGVVITNWKTTAYTWGDRSPLFDPLPKTTKPKSVATLA